MPRWSRPVRLLLDRVRALPGPDVAEARQTLVALALGLSASLVAGLTLGAITGTLERLPGLLVLVPAAIGLRGTIFGALGARLGTAIHTGTFGLSLRRGTVLGQNVVAAGILSLFASVALAVLAKVVSIGFGIERTISVADFITISVVGGLLSSAVVLVLTVMLAAGSVRYGWDPDNVTAPLVTAAGDMVTLPSLFLATYIVGIDLLNAALAVAAVGAAAAALVAGLRSRLPTTRQILRESALFVVAAGVLSLLAGNTLEDRLDALARYPALLALVPPFLASAGAIGGILSSRVTSKLHLGLVEPTPWPGRLVRDDVVLVYTIGPLVFALASLVADLAAVLVDLPSPGPGAMIAVALIGGFFATTFAVVVAYATAIISYRLGIDPDNIAIPLVTSSLDLFGALSFIVAVVALGIV